MCENRIAHFLAELTSGDDERAEKAASQIPLNSAEETDTVLTSLHGLLRSPQVDQRWWALRALAQIADPRVPGWLAQQLADPDVSVRQCAALCLSLQPAAQAVSVLVETLGDRDPLLARLAGQALAAIGAPAVEPLIEVVRGGSPQSSAGPHARREAARALAAIGDTRAAPALYAALEDDSPSLVYWAEQGLERMGVGMVFFKP